MKKEYTSELLILTEGGAKSGLGHISRCNSLYRAWEKRCKQSPWMICEGGAEVDSALIGLQAQRLPWHQQPEVLAPWLIRKPFVLVDSYHLSTETYTYLTQNARAVFCMDDCQQFDYPNAHYINGALFAERLPYPPGQHLLGSAYLPLRPPFWSTAQKTIKPQVEHLLVSFGGGDFQGLTGRLLPLLLAYSADWHIEVVIGPFFSGRPHVLEKVQSRVHYLVSPDAIDMQAAMTRSDLAISTSGQTLYELAVCGVPTLAILAAENQRANLIAWQEAGLVRELGISDAGLEQRLVRALNTTDLSWRQQAAQAGRQHVDGQGALRVVDWILRAFD